LKTDDLLKLGKFEADTWIPPEPHDLLIAVRAVIAGNPLRHRQGDWVTNLFGDDDAGKKLRQIRENALVPPERGGCGTAGCAAGWGVFLGDDPRATLGPYTSGISYPDGRTLWVADRAAELMGLSEFQRFWLFGADRAPWEVLRGLARLIEDPAAAIWDGGPS